MFKITNVRTGAVDETGLLGCRDVRNRNCNYAELRHGNGGFRRAASRRDSFRHAWHTRQLTLIYISERDFGPSVLYHHSLQLDESIRTLLYFLFSLLIRLPIGRIYVCRSTNWSIPCKWRKYLTLATFVDLIRFCVFSFFIKSMFSEESYEKNIYIKTYRELSYCEVFRRWSHQFLRVSYFDFRDFLSFLFYRFLIKDLFEKN